MRVMKIEIDFVPKNILFFLLLMEMKKKNFKEKIPEKIYTPSPRFSKKFLYPPPKIFTQSILKLILWWLFWKHVPVFRFFINPIFACWHELFSSSMLNKDGAYRGTVVVLCWLTRTKNDCFIVNYHLIVK